MNAVDDAVAVGNQGQSNYEVECMEKFEKDYKETKRKYLMMQNKKCENHILILKKRGRGRGRSRGRGRRGRGGERGRGRGREGERGRGGEMGRGIIPFFGFI